jgi:hypothetical protein
MARQDQTNDGENYQQGNETDEYFFYHHGTPSIFRSLS